MSAILEVRNHGGYCCGMSHITGFSGFGKGDIKRLKDKVQGASSLNTKGQCKLLEAVVTDRQINKHPVIKQGLKEAGFRCVSRFKNRNSGNICYVYHHYTKVD